MDYFFTMLGALLSVGVMLLYKKYKSHKEVTEHDKLVSHSKELYKKNKFLEYKLKELQIEKDSIAEKHLKSYSSKEQVTLELKEATEKVIELQEQLGEEREKNKKITSQKKSSETRIGNISENLVPFLKNCAYNPKDMHFLGAPIDYLVYDLDQGRVVFLEVKTGNSRLSKKQKTIKNIIQSGRVYYEEMRIDTRGVRLIKDKNEENKLKDNK